MFTPQEKPIERYHHAVAMKSHAEEMYRTSVQHIDSYEWRYKIQDWKKEMEEAYEELQL